MAIKRWIIITVIVVAEVFASRGVTGWAVTIETVPVGNPGNVDDTHGDGYGGVPHQYTIGKYEITARQYTEFLNKVAGVDTYSLYDTDMAMAGSGILERGCNIQRYAGSGTPDDPYRYRVADDWADRPVNYVSWGDAARFVNWLHNGQRTGLQNAATTEEGAYSLNGATSDNELMAIERDPDWKWAIPTEDEWYKAAYHKNDGVTDNYFDYPTASDTKPSATLADALITDPAPGNHATFYDYHYTVGVGKYYRTEIGEHENSDSPYGTYDQAGNVEEWNEAVRNKYGNSYRVIRGGNFYYYGQHLRADWRMGYYPTTQLNFLGFRVVSKAAPIPEPATLVGLLSAIGSLGVYLRRRLA